jgi:hypothetical protein
LPQIFNRDFAITVGNTLIQTRDPNSDEARPTLRVQFNIVKTAKREPNEAKITIYNLSPETRTALHVKNVPTLVEAGYVGTRHQIFLGDLVYSRSARQGTDWATSLQSADGASKIKGSRVNLSLKGPAKATDALKNVAEALGLKTGNLDKALAAGSLREKFQQFTQGVVLSGKADQQLDKITRSMGLTWSSQDGEIILLGPNDTLTNQVRVLSPDSGLVGSPEPGDDGIVKARALLLPELSPNFRVQIDSAEVKGFYKILKTTYSGDTAGGEWYADIECAPLN